MISFHLSLPGQYTKGEGRPMTQSPNTALALARYARVYPNAEKTNASPLVGAESERWFNSCGIWLLGWERIPKHPFQHTS